VSDRTGQVWELHDSVVLIVGPRVLISDTPKIWRNPAIALSSLHDPVGEQFEILEYTPYEDLPHFMRIT
jgi:hypothetical protein